MDKEANAAQSLKAEDKAMTPEPAPVPIYEATFTKTAAQIAQAQEYLIRLGLHPGPSSGEMTPITRDAIMAYQAANDLETDGQVNQRVMAHLANSMSVLESSAN